MFKIFLKMAVGSSCLLLIACSANNYTNSVKLPLESHIVDNHDGTFTDITNHLQWTKNDSTPGPGGCYEGDEKNFWFMKWHMDCLNQRRYLGYSDWRMPTYEELESLLATPEIKNGSILNSQVHERLRNHAYWSTADLALFIYMRGIMIYNAFGPTYIYHRDKNYYVWPVRSNNNAKRIASYRGN